MKYKRLTRIYCFLFIRRRRCLFFTTISTVFRQLRMYFVSRFRPTNNNLKRRGRGIDNVLREDFENLYENTTFPMYRIFSGGGGRGGEGPRAIVARFKVARYQIEIMNISYDFGAAGVKKPRKRTLAITTIRNGSTRVFTRADRPIVKTRAPKNNISIAFW